MQLSTLTALDMLGVRPTLQADGTYRHACTVCGAAAVTTRYQTSCSDKQCRLQAAAPLDLIALKAGSYAAAARWVNTERRNDDAVSRREAEDRRRHRRILDTWLDLCSTEPVTVSHARVTGKLLADGMRLLPGQRGMVSLTEISLRRLADLAKETGAEYPDSLDIHVPPAALAFVVQTHPCRVDRIVLCHGRNSVTQIIWDRRSVGIIGLIGAGGRRYVAADYRAALELQERFYNVGRPQEVAAVFCDPEGDACLNEWSPRPAKLVMIPRTPADVITFSRLYDSFPESAASFTAIHYSKLLSIEAATSSYEITWREMRSCYLAASIADHATSLSAYTLRLLEQSNPSRGDVSELIAYFRRAGRLQLADDLRRHLNNRVIFESARLKVRETASEYVTESSMATNTIANFALQFTHNLLFRDNVDLLHQAKLIFGRGTYSVALTAQALENPDRLQEAVRAQVMSSREARTQDTLPTVIDKANFKKYLVPHFKRQVANLKPLEGVNNLGWTIDRLMFAGPGLKVTMSGRSLVQVPFHPSAPSLRYMRPSVEWSDVFPENLSRPSADLVAMILASCVRYYVKSITRPLCVHHSPASRKLLQSMFRAIGQHDTFELNPNARDNAGVPGVRGFPFLVTGYNAAQAEAARFSHVLLTDTGYSVPEELLPEEAEAAGRALQSGLLRVAEWCLATGAEDFTESSSLHYNTSLLREGRWVMENVCDRQPWEVSDLGLAHLEGLLAQIPVAETAQRLTLHEGRLLTMDTRGLVWDPERVGADLKTISTDYRIDGDKLEMNAVGILPGLSMFYGREPEIASTF